MVGLGNPGSEYAGTRHNAGFEVISLLSKRFGIPLRRKVCFARVGEGFLSGRTLMLVTPETYMNAIGTSVACLLRRYGLAPQEVLVVSDDIDLALGTVRIRPKGGAGTHNGFRSILQHTGSELFPRVRVGIGTPPPFTPLSDWVLSRVDPTSAQIQCAAYERAADAVAWAFARGITSTMNRFNARIHEKHSVQQTP